MTEAELIAKQQLEIENLKEMLEYNYDVLNTIKGRFINCGSPLNDNCLGFNKEQIKWAYLTYEAIETLYSLKPYEDELVR